MWSQTNLNYYTPLTLPHIYYSFISRHYGHWPPQQRFSTLPCIVPVISTSNSQLCVRLISILLSHLIHSLPLSISHQVAYKNLFKAMLFMSGVRTERSEQKKIVTRESSRAFGDSRSRGRIIVYRVPLSLSLSLIPSPRARSQRFCKSLLHFFLSLSLSLSPVSYTHLDVYKRQVLDFISNKKVS